MDKGVRPEIMRREAHHCGRQQAMLCDNTRRDSKLAAKTPTMLAKCDWQSLDVTGTQVM